MSDLYYVELDVYDDTDLLQQCEEFGIIGEEIEPGRNWQMFKYTGTYDKLKKFVIEIYQDDLTEYFEKVS